MHYLRSPRFILISLLIAVGGYLLGSAITTGTTLSNLLAITQRTVKATTGPPGPVRLTHAEIAERDRHLRAVFGDAVPVTMAFWDPGFVTLRNATACLSQRPASMLASDNACDAVPLNAFRKLLLAYSDPRTETLFLRRGRDRRMDAAFFLGKDGKAKILMYDAHQNIGGDKWISVVVPYGTQTMLVNTGVHDVWFGDDPGPGPDERAITFFVVGKYHRPDTHLDQIIPDTDLKQRFQYYAALKNKPYNAKEWINACPRTPDGCAPP